LQPTPLAWCGLGRNNTRGSVSTGLLIPTGAPIYLNTSTAPMQNWPAVRFRSPDVCTVFFWRWGEGMSGNSNTKGRTTIRPAFSIVEPKMVQRQMLIFGFIAAAGQSD
jgi:hypothetical protein